MEHSKLAKAIAHEEGFENPKNLPFRRNNPGDLRHSPHSSHDGIGKDDIGKISSAEFGWEDLERQLEIYASRGLTLKEMIDIYAPPSENNTSNYLHNVCRKLNVGPDTLVREILNADKEQKA